MIEKQPLKAYPISQEITVPIIEITNHAIPITTSIAIIPKTNSMSCAIAAIVLYF